MINTLKYIILLTILYSVGIFASDEDIYLEFPDKSNETRQAVINNANTMVNTNSSNTTKGVDQNHFKQHQDNTQINVPQTNGQGYIQHITPSYPAVMPPTPSSSPY